MTSEYNISNFSKFILSTLKTIPYHFTEGHLYQQSPPHYQYTHVYLVLISFSASQYSIIHRSTLEGHLLLDELCPICFHLEDFYIL